MTVGLVDVDGGKFPNLALMKLSSWHKMRGDSVEMAFPLRRYDMIYKSKVFTFSKDIDWEPMAEKVIEGGTGYDVGNKLQYEIEHVCPDWSLYGVIDTAYGFLSRGCPRGCPFCIVASKEGRKSIKNADLSEWWSGQSNIVLMDPNILACKDRADLLSQLKESGATVDFNQGVDVRLLDDNIADVMVSIKTKRLHFAWDGLDDLEEKFRQASEVFGKLIRSHRLTVYVLVNYNSSMEWNLHRVRVLSEMGYDPYVMVYDKLHAPKEIRRLQRWCNMKSIFKTVKWEDYK